MTHSVPFTAARDLDGGWKTRFLGPVSQFIMNFLWLCHFSNSQFFPNIKQVVSPVDRILLSYSLQVLFKSTPSSQMEDPASSPLELLAPKSSGKVGLPAGIFTGSQVPAVLVTGPLAFKGLGYITSEPCANPLWSNLPVLQLSPPSKPTIIYTSLISAL